ncbi:MAG: hypothetical protein M1831_001428 [Alyxoria varia]|nr:MAG: hypothetical protein M1831_001428 [Alyxoria varia]
MENGPNVEGSVTHRVFLIRHGETVDNVAGLYAGVRDSALTSHGHQQAARLGTYFFENGARFSTIFSSDLSRAVKTAQAVKDAANDGKNDEASPPVVELKELREQDFGSLEGKSWSSTRENAAGREKPRDGESKEYIQDRAFGFIKTYLTPHLAYPEPRTIAVVSHGMLLHALWWCLVHLQRRDGISLCLRGRRIEDSKTNPLEYIATWSNTGFMELDIGCTRLAPSDGEAPTSSYSTLSECISSHRSFHGRSPVCVSMAVKGLDRKDHLQSLKRTRGGIGSSKHDESQKSIDTFFKRRKVD